RPICCNPLHLYASTLSQNTTDMHMRPKLEYIKQHDKPYGDHTSMWATFLIRRLILAKVPVKSLADITGLTLATIYRIKNNETTVGMWPESDTDNDFVSKFWEYRKRSPHRFGGAPRGGQAKSAPSSAARLLATK
ncbi:MAG: hypothetical protein AAGK66_08915, partial [Pseudomonadota bacterium]